MRFGGNGMFRAAARAACALLAALTVGTVSLLLTPGHVRGAAFEFSDVPDAHWAAAAIRALRGMDIVNGTPGGRFDPSRPVSRAEWAKMLVLARGMTPARACQQSFSDVTCDSWYRGAVETAHRVAMMDGQGDGGFRPDSLLTRQEAAVSLVRALGTILDPKNVPWALPASLKAFPDGNQAAPWAQASLDWLVRHQILNGRDGLLAPGANTSRAEAAMLVHRLVARRPLPVAEQEVDGQTIRFHHSLHAKATKYATGEPGVGDTTYSGLKVRLGTVATDPNVIPLGTYLYVEGYGYAVAADIGGAVRGEHVDLFTHSLSEAEHWGVQRLRIFLLD